MSKLKVYNEVLEQLNDVLGQLKLDDTAAGKIRAVIDNVLKPKSGGSFTTKDIKDIARFDKDGKITHLLCQYAGVFLPATDEFFYKDGAGKPGIGGTGLRRASKLGEMAVKQLASIKKSQANNYSVMVLNKEISVEDAKQHMATLDKLTPNFAPIAKFAEGGYKGSIEDVKNEIKSAYKQFKSTTDIKGKDDVAEDKPVKKVTPKNAGFGKKLNN